MLAFVLPIFLQKNASGRPGPPNHSASCFFSFHDLHVAAFLTRFTKIYKDFGIHQRLFEETSLKASILPRRSGRSPLQYIYIYVYIYISGRKSPVEADLDASGRHKCTRSYARPGVREHFHLRRCVCVSKMCWHVYPSACVCVFHYVALARHNFICM